MTRPPCIHHCTPEPFQFFGRKPELELLKQALHGGEPSVVAMTGPGGQGKTAIVQTWLQRVRCEIKQIDGIFFWSFYRGKDSDLCLREMYRYADGMEHLPDVSGSFCVDHLVPIMRRERWAVILDGTEVVQHESGSWFGRFLHPDLGRLLEELANEPSPGVAIVTTRFPLPELQHRRHAKVLSLGSLDSESAASLMRSLGVHGTESARREAAETCGHHAKAVELLATYLHEFHDGDGDRFYCLPELGTFDNATDEELCVWRVLTAFRQSLPAELQDILALATAFRHPPAESRLCDYLVSAPVQKMLHQNWKRFYRPFAERHDGWLPEQIQKLVELRLLERVHSGRAEGESELVIDAHPLVRRGFAQVLGNQEHQQSAQARAGFLSGRPDRRAPESLSEAAEEVELFHAYADAGMWNEADGVLVALDNPKHRFLAPAFERDLLLRFFHERNWRGNPLWPGFGRYRSLAICSELLGRFDEALQTYPPPDAPLRGDSLIALGDLAPFLEITQVSQPWQNLWQAYRAHGLCLAGQTQQSLALAGALVPVDVYEWIHVFECLLRNGQLQLVDLCSLLYRPQHSSEHRWGGLARQRMRLDWLRINKPGSIDFDAEYRHVNEEYDRGGLPYERALSRLGFARWQLMEGQAEHAKQTAETILQLAERFGMRIMAADAWELLAKTAGDDKDAEETAKSKVQSLREAAGYFGPPRP